MKPIIFSRLTLLIIMIIFPIYLEGQEKSDIKYFEQVDKVVSDMMEEGGIPGLSIVIVKDGSQTIKNYGYADLDKNIPVTSSTLFQLASCSKAFTALAVLHLEQQGKINLDHHISMYLPWFKVTYKDKEVAISLRQFLHHTSGIPSNTISKIPQSNAPDALEQTIRTLVGQELEELPGKKYEYATINYDVLALVIEKVTQQSFESYVEDNILGPLQLNTTSVGQPSDSIKMATGYKIGFFAPRAYEAPVFKGNNAAGYVFTNASDLSIWLKFQMGMTQSDLYDLAKKSHVRDESVSLHNMASYAGGWNISLDGKGEIYHTGLNPNFTSFIAFRPDQKLGIALMANSNSNYTSLIGQRLMELAAGEEITTTFEPGDNGDKLFSSISIAIGFYILVVLVFISFMIIEIAKRKRKFESVSIKKFFKFFLPLTILVPFVYGFYIMPQAILGFSWEAIMVWTPVSFKIFIEVLLVAIAISYVSHFMGLHFPDQNEYKNKAPQIMLMSVLSGLSNVILIILVTNSIGSDIEPKYLAFYFGLTMGIYLLGRRYVQVSLIRFGRGLVYDLRIQLIEKIFATSYEKFEKIKRGRVYTAFDDDINIIGASTSVVVSMVTSTITAIGAFMFLAFISGWATMLTIFLIVSLSTIYYVVSQQANPYIEKSRDSRNVFMNLMSGMLEGFTELSMHLNKKLSYKADMEESAEEYRDKMNTADIKFLNGFLIGESLLVTLLGAISIGMSIVFPDIELYTIMSFVIILLYLIGPINQILGSIPFMMKLKVAWNRLQSFIKEIPANLNLEEMSEKGFPELFSIEARGITFQFESDDKKCEGFKVGPINLTLEKGEILFIVGGNGSGKSTLAKLLTGLFEPQEGSILINGEKLESYQLSEYFSSVLSSPYIFEKLYGIDTGNMPDELEKYLKLLDLDQKVEIKDNKYSTIDLSSGQRKRLALLQCYLLDSPIYLFDEWAADQDPGYRNFFYRTLLPEMKKRGKIVIAITHDDHYFDVADRVLKMKQGQMEAFFDDFPLSARVV